MEHNFIDFDAAPDSPGGAPIPITSHKLGVVRDFCVTWIRAVKTLCLYPETNPLPGEFRDKFFDALESILESESHIDLTTFDGGFSYEGETVVENSDTEEGISGILFRDGVRRITFDAGITKEESDRFLALMAEASVAGTAHADIANLLWEAGFDHIRHFTVDRVVEGAYIAPANDSALEDVHHRFVDSNASELAESEDEESSEDEGPYSGAQGERFRYLLNVFGDVRCLSEAEKGELAAMATPHSDEHLEQTGIEILFEVARGADSPRIADEAVRVMERQYEHLVEGDRWDLTHLLLKEWCASLKSASPRVEQNIHGAISRASSPKTFDRLASYLNRHPQAKLAPVRDMLPLFGPSAVTPITAMLGTLEHRPARMVICEFLADNGRETIDLIGGFIYDKRWYVVRNVAMILGEIGHERALVFLQKSAVHGDHRVRLETLRAAQRYTSRNAEKLVRGFLSDPEPDIRRRALRALSHNGSASSASDLERMINDSYLPDKDPVELRDLFSAYARVGGEKAVKELVRIAAKTRFLGGARWLPVRVAAVLGMGASPVTSARAELGILSRKGNRAIAQAAHQALTHRARSEAEREDPWTDSHDEEPQS